MDILKASTDPEIMRICGSRKLSRNAIEHGEERAIPVGTADKNRSQAGAPGGAADLSSFMVRKSGR
jgi:hypothetical protein